MGLVEGIKLMAWTVFPLTAGALPTKGVQDTTLWQELEDAVNERCTAAGIGTISISGTSPGDRLFQTSALVAIQQKIEDLVPYFVDHTDSLGDWDGVSAKADVAPAWNFGSGDNNILSAAHANVGNESNWTRRHGSKSTLSTSYGQVQIGDVAAIYEEASVTKIAEYLNEMYRVIDLLRWTKTSTFSDSVEGYTLTRNGTLLDTFNTLWAWLVANWAHSWGASSGDPFHKSALRQWGGGSPGRQAGGYNVRANLTLSGLPSHVQRSCAWYLYGFGSGHVDIDEWDDDGLGYTENVYNLVTTTGETGGAVASGWIGNDVTLQDRPSADPGGPDDIYRGWQLSVAQSGYAGVAVVKWDGLNGFTKLS